MGKAAVQLVPDRFVATGVWGEDVEIHPCTLTRQVESLHEALPWLRTFFGFEVTSTEEIRTCKDGGDMDKFSQKDAKQRRWRLHSPIFLLPRAEASFPLRLLATWSRFGTTQTIGTLTDHAHGFLNETRF